jgi:hypothetical protein
MKKQLYILFITMLVVCLATTTTRAITCTGDSPPVSGDWILTQDTYCHDGDIYINQESGLINATSYNLTLRRVNLVFNDTTDPSFLGAILTFDGILDFKDTRISTVNESKVSGQFFSIINGGNIAGPTWIGGTTDKWYFDNVTFINIGEVGYLNGLYPQGGSALSLYYGDTLRVTNSYFQPQQYQIFGEAQNDAYNIISAYNVTNVLIDNNDLTFDDEGSGSNNYLNNAIRLWGCNGAVITDNYINLNRTSNSPSAFVNNGAQNVLFEGNDITLSTYDNGIDGITLSYWQPVFGGTKIPPDNNILRNNRMYAEDMADGSWFELIYIDGNSTNMLIDDNDLTGVVGTGTDGTWTAGVTFYQSGGTTPRNLTVTNNKIDITGAGDAGNIYVENPSDKLTITGNTLIQRVYGKAVSQNSPIIFLTSYYQPYELEIVGNTFNYSSYGATGTSDLTDGHIAVYDSGTKITHTTISQNTGYLYAPDGWLGSMVSLRSCENVDSSYNNWNLYTGTASDTIDVRGFYLDNDIQNLRSTSDLIYYHGTANNTAPPITINEQFTGANAQNISFDRLLVLDWQNPKALSVSGGDDNTRVDFISSGIETTDLANKYQNVIENGKVRVYYMMQAKVDTTTGRPLENAYVTAYDNSTGDVLWVSQTNISGQTKWFAVPQEIYNSTALEAYIGKYRIETNYSGQHFKTEYLLPVTEDTTVEVTFIEWLTQQVSKMFMGGCSDEMYNSALQFGIIIFLIAGLAAFILPSKGEHMKWVYGFGGFLIAVAFAIAAIVGC